MKKSILRASAALHVVAILGAGFATSTIVATPAMAQDYTNVTASGRVQSTAGRPIAGATVVLNSDQGVTRTLITDQSGSFQAAQIAPGTYRISVTAPGFAPLTDNVVSITQNNAANEFTLAPVAAAGAAPAGGSEIVVTGVRRIVDFAANTTGSVIQIGDLAKRVPVARDITSVVLLSPGTSAGDTAFGNLPSINGASVSENVYYINGLDITQFRNGLGAVTVPFDFYQSVDVKNGGIPAEFGRTTGGVINATTKRGTNKFHGSLTANYEPDSLRKDVPNTFASDNDSSYGERKDVVAQLSGPIIKDHLFFYGLYQARDVTSGGGFTGTANALDPRISPTTGLPRSQTSQQLNASCFINPTMCTDFADLRNANLTLQGTQYIKDRSRSPFYGGKIDAVFGGQRLEGTIFNTSGVTNRDVFGTAVYSLASGNRYNPNTNAPGGYVSSTVFRSGGLNYVGRYTGSFTNWLTLSAAYGVNKNRETTESSTPNFPSIVDQRGGTSTSIGNTTANANVNFDKRTFYRADADLTFNLLGRHHVRGGYDREDLKLSTLISANGGFQYTYFNAAADRSGIDPVTGLPSGTPYATARTFQSGGQFATRNTAFYVQDQWSLLDNRLQLNLGLRNDKFVSRNGAGTAFYKSGSNWSPRVGFSVDPFGEGKTKIYGSFSRYFLPVAVNTNVRLAGSELDYDAYYRLTGLNADSTPILGAPITTGAGFETCPTGGPAGTSCVVRNDGSIPGTATTVASNLKAQSTDEFIIGAEHRSGRLKFGLFGTYTKLNNSLEDASIDQAVIPLCVAAGNTEASCRGIYNGVHQYVLINPGQNVAVTLSDPFPNEANARTVELKAADLGYPQARRTYKAITATFEREFDGKWGLVANYTWSKLKGNIEGGIRSDNGQTDSGLTTAFDLPALVNGSYGYLPNDRRHNLKIYGSYAPTKWLSFGAQLQVASPRHFGCIGRAPRNADANLAGRFYGASAFYCNLDSSGNVVRFPITSAPGAFPVVTYPFANPAAPGTSTLQLTPRASRFKSDWLYNLNLDVALKVPSSAFDGTVRLSVFNVLNRQAKLDFNEVGTSGAGAPLATYSLPTNYQQSRSVRLQFNVGF